MAPAAITFTAFGRRWTLSRLCVCFLVLMLAATTVICVEDEFVNKKPEPATLVRSKSADRDDEYNFYDSDEQYSSTESDEIGQPFSYKDPIDEYDEDLDLEHEKRKYDDPSLVEIAWRECLDSVVRGQRC